MSGKPKATIEQTAVRNGQAHWRLQVGKKQTIGEALEECIIPLRYLRIITIVKDRGKRCYFVVTEVVSNPTPDMDPLREGLDEQPDVTRLDGRS